MGAFLHMHASLSDPASMRVCLWMVVRTRTRRASRRSWWTAWASTWRGSPRASPSSRTHAERPTRHAHPNSLICILYVYFFYINVFIVNHLPVSPNLSPPLAWICTALSLLFPCVDALQKLLYSYFSAKGSTSSTLGAKRKDDLASAASNKKAKGAAKGPAKKGGAGKPRR